MCTGSVSDSITAFKAGADRIELNCALELGGLSPSPGTLSETVESVSIPVIAMVRPHPGGFSYSRREKAAMLADIDFFLSRGASGIAAGATLPSGGVDTGFMKEIRKLAGNCQLVFHRAFDLLPDAMETASLLAELGVDRILTSGRRRTALEGKETIRNLIQGMGNRMEILPGAGISSGNVEALVESTGCRAVHGSFSAPVSFPESEPGVLPSQGIGTCAIEILKVIKALGRSL